MGCLLFLHFRNMRINRRDQDSGEAPSSLEQTCSRISISKFDYCKTEDLEDTSSVYDTRMRRDLLVPADENKVFSKSMVEEELQFSLEQRKSPNQNNQMAKTAKILFVESIEEEREDEEGTSSEHRSTIN